MKFTKNTKKLNEADLKMVFGGDDLQGTGTTKSAPKVKYECQELSLKWVLVTSQS